MPLDSRGWTVVRHAPECLDEQANATICTPSTCLGDTSELVCFDGTSDGFRDAMHDVATVLGSITKQKATDDRAPELLEASRFVAVVSSPWRPADQRHTHFQRCFDLLHDSVKALRQATQARVPNVTIERVWPVYFVVDQDNEKHLQIQNLVFVEHGHLPGGSPATSGQLMNAESLLVASWSRNPVEIYLDFELGAQNATYTDGDYVEAVLKAAAAAESLIKLTAWMLTWEASTQLESDPTPNAQADLGGSRPAKLISAIIAPRLKGNWSSQTDASPVGAWRRNIARPRNAVIHRGNRPDSELAHRAILALHELEQHILDRLAAGANTYPRTAYLLAGPESLDRRGASGKVRATLAHSDPRQWLPDYLRWLEATVQDDDSD
jgi:hypothetical protein